MQPFKDVFAILLDPKELVDPQTSTRRLQFRSEGQEFEFSQLSSARANAKW